MSHTVLIADDELHLTHILRFKLEQAGLQVLVANDGQEAFQMAMAHAPHLVISDFQMPVMDGFAMCVKLKETPQTASIPVLMLTARGHKLSPSQLAQTNIAYMMAKPFSAMELIDKVMELLTHHSDASTSCDNNIRVA